MVLYPEEYFAFAAGRQRKMDSARNWRAGTHNRHALRHEIRL
jgi:hypothetical protein